MTGHGIVIPIPENVGICGTAIFIRYSVNSLVVVVVYGSGDAVSSKSTIDFSWINLKKMVKEKSIIIENKFTNRV